MTKGVDKRRRRIGIEKFDRPITVLRTSDDYNSDRFVHCTICDNLAYFRVSEDTSSVIRVNYYCKNCVSKCSLAQ